ncbi:fused MFS/spermidine synthase [Paracoccus sp. ME4]|uniref:fused MFS/spermidine synthase n=1 Tax=Paracoccus sp. ME4 TaxID=3138066 RepID=UPI00398BA3B4
MRFWTTIALILILSAAGLTYEIAAGRVLAPFFGTSLVTWTSVIAVILTGFSLGNALGGLIAERPRYQAMRMIRAALVLTAVLMALSPAVLSLIYAMGARGTGGMLLSVTVAFFPASVLISLPSPLLASLAVEARPGREGSSLGMVLAAGSLGAILGAVMAGFVALPLIGSVATFAGCGLAALVSALLIRGTGAPPTAIGPGRAMLMAGGAVAAAAVVAGGPLCRFESGMSCIDVLAHGDRVTLFSDRVPQAAERLRAQDGSHLALPYTDWIWARMQRDLGPAPSVLFIGGGGYGLPAQLLSARPDARAVAVEIDPLITRVVRAEMPWAGSVLAERGAEGGPDAPGRLTVVHADGRVFLNDTTRRFDAVVMDAFSSDTVPAHLATLEAYRRVRAVTDGPVYVNLIDRPDGPLARGIHAILGAVYPHVEAVRGPLSARGRTNILMVASPTPLASGVTLPEGYAPYRVAQGRAFTDDRGWIGHR